MATILERVVLAAGSLAAVLSLVEAIPAVAVLAFATVATLLGAVRLAADHARWQLWPAYLAVAWLWLGLAVDLPASARIAGGTLALLLLATATVLSIGMPVPKLPQPDGPFGVGTISTMEERDNATTPPTAPRRLFIKLWYPTEPDTPRQRRSGEALWSEFRETPGIPAALRLLTGYLRQVRTHSVRAAPFSRSATGSPVVLYHHGLVSISAENTLLMESLASHGYVVVSTRHTDQRAELDEVGADADPAVSARVSEINKLLPDVRTRDERARLSQSAYRLSTGTATIVGRRAADSRHVLDRLPNLLARIPSYPRNLPDSDLPTAAAGLSLGGAVATELGKTDERCRAVVNIDGGLYGPNLEAPIAVPYLMVYSELNAGGNDLALKTTHAPIREVTVPGAKHLDFHDAAVVLPILRWIGQLGKVSAAEVTALKNREIRRFLDQTLRATESPTPVGGDEAP
jgi:dienelactone hydrolase